MYSFDLVALVLDMLPLKLRGAVRLLALIEAMAAPLKPTIDGMPAYATAMLRQARWNGQRAIMEAAVNEVFPQGGGLILIETVSIAIARPATYFLHEAQPPLHIYAVAELLSYVDFQVLVPTGTVVDFDAITQFINRLKIAGKRFEVINY